MQKMQKTNKELVYLLASKFQATEFHFYCMNYGLQNSYLNLQSLQDKKKWPRSHEFFWKRSKKVHRDGLFQMEQELLNQAHTQTYQLQ